MARRGLRAAVLLSLVMLVASVVASSAATVLAPAAPAVGQVLLTLFTGGATVVRPGAGGVPGHTGDHLANGDTVLTADDSKASLLYPDGSVTRLDSDTTVKVHVTTSGSGIRADLEQTTGLTWNRVQRLVASERFTISGPNSASAQVRGTEFGYYVEHDPQGNPVIWVDVWSGTVQVTGAVGPPVTGTDGQRVTVRLGAAPTTPAPIPPGDRQLAFTVFNRALNAVAGEPVAFGQGTLSSGGTSGPVSLRADGHSDLYFVLAWPGSTYRFTVRDPGGNVAGSSIGAAPPLIVNVPQARAGTWIFTVDDVQSDQPEAWWVVVGRTPD